jgi:hypothetical protein
VHFRVYTAGGAGYMDAIYAGERTPVAGLVPSGTQYQVLTTVAGAATWADGSKKVLTTTGDLLHASAANTPARLAIGTTDQELVVASGLPSWYSGAKKLLDATGAMLYASAANVLAKLGIGSTDQVLTIAGGVPTWADGSKKKLTTTGDILYASAANTLARLGIGTAPQNLGIAAGVPSWLGDTAWTAPTLAGTWVNFGGGYNNAGYWKDSTGRVHLRGMIKSGTIGTTAFTLPSGYRPSATCRFAAESNSAYGICTIDSAGVVTPAAGNTAWFSFDGMSFNTA